MINLWKTNRLFEENNKNIKLELKDTKEENGLILGVNTNNQCNGISKIQITISKGVKMETKIINDIAIVKNNEIIIKDVQSAIDFIMNIKYETNCNKIALNKDAIIEDFFILSKGLAGEILQKFINYQTKFAIYGDYSKYTSKPLKDFIYESNNGKDIFFVKNEDEAIKMLSK